MTLRGSPELLGVPGVMPGLEPGEEGRTPLPTSTTSGEAPPSTGVSGASSSRNVDRLYSTICQTTGGADPGQADRALCPRPSPSAPGPAGPPPACCEAPSLLPGAPAWDPSDAPVPYGRSPRSTSWSPRPMPPVPRPYHLPPRVSALQPGSPTHVAAAAAQLLQRDVHGGVRTGSTLGLPEAGPRPGRGLGARPGLAAHHRRHCHSPLLGRRCPRLLEPPPCPPRRRARGWGGGEGEERTSGSRHRRRPGARGLPCRAARTYCPSQSEPPSRNAGDPSSLKGQHPIPAAPSHKPPIIYVPLT